ncbi:MAG: aminoacetone oxidase family FAD-binding enzyme [Lachnospiraceae bacterium]|nr:aminoacetone oxidase family FAD-binding enzyme [Lachnospiraceae bacterium]
MKTTIIGGGASGMAAAVFASKRGDEVTVLEHNDRIGKKILQTGNGRCNLTNSTLEGPVHGNFSSLSPSGIRFCDDVIKRFGYKETLRFFKSLGLEFRQRGDLVYPKSDQASSVLDALRFALEELKVSVKTGIEVRSVKKEKDKGFIIKTDDGTFSCDRLIIAAGSKAAPQTGSDGSGYAIAESFGHRIERPMPALVPLKCKGDFFKSVSGVRCPVKLSLSDGDKVIYNESGELQYTQYGISGIVTMNISNRLHLCKKNAFVFIDHMENDSKDELCSMLMERRERFRNRSVKDLMTGVINKKLFEMLLKESGIDMNREVFLISDEEIKTLASHIKEFKIKIEGTMGFDHSQICMGGIDPVELDENMQSRIVPSLYFCGEIIDAHGDCGGYNLQLCWSTGAIAGSCGELEDIFL